jgi:hypothetical protein
MMIRKIAKNDEANVLRGGGDDEKESKFFFWK